MYIVNYTAYYGGAAHLAWRKFDNKRNAATFCRKVKGWIEIRPAFA